MGDETPLSPEEISCGEQVFDMKFHPYADVIAAGLIDGVVKVYKYTAGEESQELLHLTHHRGSSCRGVEFDPLGQKLYSISSDCSWACVDSTGNMILSHQNAHLAPINKCLLIDENCFVTGDDNGCVKLWDVRTSSETATFHEQEDFITSLNYHEDAHTLLCTSGDSTLCAYDIRKRIPKNGKTTDIVMRSDEQESELNAVTVIKGGKKVVCGTQSGVILVFSWNRWGDCSDRYPGHPQPVDCMLKIDENTILTGSSDGLIRVVGLLPNKIYGVLGDHEDFPVEGMCRSRDGLYLGTISHDDLIRFWDMSMFMNDTSQGDDDAEEEEEGESEEKGGDVQREDEEECDMSEEEDEEEDEGQSGKTRGDDDSDDSEEDDDSSSEDDVPEVKMPAFKFPAKKKGFYADL